MTTEVSGIRLTILKHWTLISAENGGTQHSTWECSWSLGILIFVGKICMFISGQFYTRSGVLQRNHKNTFILPSNKTKTQLKCPCKFLAHIITNVVVVDVVVVAKHLYCAVSPCSVCVVLQAISGHWSRNKETRAEWQFIVILIHTHVLSQLSFEGKCPSSHHFLAVDKSILSLSL